MKLTLHATFALLLLVCAPISSRAESSVGKVFRLREGLELKILELRRTKEQTVMLRYALTNSSTQDMAGDTLGFEDNFDQRGPLNVSLIDMQSRK
jgi:hypothetical protein